MYSKTKGKVYHYEDKLTKNIRPTNILQIYTKFLPPKRRKTLRSY